MNTASPRTALKCYQRQGYRGRRPRRAGLGAIRRQVLDNSNRDGRIFTFAQNLVDFGSSTYSRPNNSVIFTGNQRANEWAGACFDSSGDWLFANIQTPGITFAITGPWHNGPL